MDSLNILAWNARGVVSHDFRRVFRKLVAKYKPNIILLTETRVGGLKAQRAIFSLGFPTWYIVEPMGYAGGMWLLWDEDKIKLTIHGYTFQEIHTTTKISQLPTLFLSFIYGNHDRTIRKCLWNNLSSLAPLVSLPWLMSGDFHDVLSQDEKWGLRPTFFLAFVIFNLVWILLVLLILVTVVKSLLGLIKEIMVKLFFKDWIDLLVMLIV